MARVEARAHLSADVVPGVRVHRDGKRAEVYVCSDGGRLVLSGDPAVLLGWLWSAHWLLSSACRQAECRAVADA